ncbi:unnamed protein product [Oikopleura dioica]|uniref:Uncharacterized protein n=1 Tax=Oikopleura dioica TaxID=34765 RepID=E4YIW4_OIKDI|nr:unnamed protein product [Oikopleura dioica]
MFLVTGACLAFFVLLIVILLMCYCRLYYACRKENPKERHNYLHKKFNLREVFLHVIQLTLYPRGRSIRLHDLRDLEKRSKQLHKLTYLQVTLFKENMRGSFVLRNLARERCLVTTLQQLKPVKVDNVERKLLFNRKII